MHKPILSLLFLFMTYQVIAQDRCGTVEYEKMLHNKNPLRENIDQFESWIKDKITSQQKGFQTKRVESATYMIPVVVHVIHNGEAVGSGTNISDAQILSQIQVLNDDFQRMNADASKTLDEFKPVAGSFPVTFVMAKQDPNGQATSGIVRVKGTQTSWGISDNYTLKALSYWPAEDYLNIWVTNLNGGLLGYTQTPVSSTLQGLDQSSGDRLTDGVVVHYKSYGTALATGGGSFNLLSEYNLGRTATHEIGHFFGLRHVWGDVFDCSTSTDYVDDTPVQDTNYNGTCPSVSQTDCNGHAMFSNYMNYTDDACMNIYSKGQVNRMDIVINNSPRRTSLLSSLGLQLPAPVANDVQIKSIVTPGAMTCGNVTPAITLHNFGSNNITSAQVRFSLNGNPVETKTFPLTLTPTSEANVSFSTIGLSSGSTYNFSFSVIQTNGGTDGNSTNNMLSASVQVPVPASLPLSEHFNSIPANWTISNPDGLTTWSNIATGSGNNAMYVNFVDYENSGSSDFLITPVLDLTSATVASISFDYAYAMYTGGSNDGLRILVSTSCDFNSAVEIFNKSGGALVTAPATGAAFVPNSSQWKNAILSLTQFLGQKIQIAFVGVNDYGNNLYIDNVAVQNFPITQYTLNSLVSPSPVSCTNTSSPVISLTNGGNIAITSFTLNYYVNNQKSTKIVTATINPNETKNITLPQVSFIPGNNTFAVAINSPNGIPSVTAPTDSINVNVVINAAADLIPLREKFDSGTETWISVSKTVGGSTWSPVTVTPSKLTSMEYGAFTNQNIGQQAWLVSPVLDFSNALKASVFFETSYGYHSSGSETLQVLYSKDCGVTFNKALFSSSGALLSNVNSNSAWQPTSDNFWRKNYISLDSLAGSTNMRIAFVVTNGNGNNLYLDNIEFFTDDNLNPIAVDPGYSVYGGLGSPVKVTFNLPEKQLVRMQTYDMVGRIVDDELLPDTLNQTYTIDFPNESRGIYVVKIQTSSSLRSTRIVLGF